jgi:GNAT superfamily N-acetyltransferase
MTIDIVVSDMPANSSFARTAAKCAFDQWGELHPHDSVQTYLNLFAEAEQNPQVLPLCLAALTSDGYFAGTASIVVDDALPNAIEPGPWLASVFVNPEYRGMAVGKQLVVEAVRRARELGYGDLHLYTENVQHWYETLGWERVRETHIRNTPVTVMVNRC